MLRLHAARGAALARGAARVPVARRVTVAAQRGENTWSTRRGASKERDAPPPSVVNMRNMQRRRGGNFRFDARVPRTRRRSTRTRDHLYQLSHKISRIAREQSDPIKAFKSAQEALYQGMSEWHRLARQARAQHDAPMEDLSPQIASAAWNQVIVLGARAGSPNGAWKVYCDMKKAHLTPTLTTYTSYFHALTHMLRTGKLDSISATRWVAQVDSLYNSLEALCEAAATPSSGADTPRQRVLRETRRDVAGTASAYSAYLSLLFALGRSADAMALFEQLCPPPGSFGTERPTKFASARFFTSVMRDLCLSDIDEREKRRLCGTVWGRWQQALQASPSSTSLLLDNVAVKTLVWSFTFTQDSAVASAQLCALLARYFDMRFPRVPYMTRGVAPPLYAERLRVTDAALLVDILTFFNQRRQYALAADVLEQLPHGSIDAAQCSPAVNRAMDAYRHLGDFHHAAALLERVAKTARVGAIPATAGLQSCAAAVRRDARSAQAAWDTARRIVEMCERDDKLVSTFIDIACAYTANAADASAAACDALRLVPDADATQHRAPLSRLVMRALSGDTRATPDEKRRWTQQILHA